MGSAPRVLGVLSDTHGLLRPEISEAFRGCWLILHAGDVGHPAVLEGLRALAPVVAVKGNVDRWAEEGALPPTQVLDVEGVRIYLLHDLEELDLVPEAAGIRCVIHGHTHRPEVRWKGEVLYLNPGSAGPRRPGRPVTLARLVLEEAGGLVPEIVPLSEEPAPLGPQGEGGQPPPALGPRPRPSGTCPPSGGR